MIHLYYQADCAFCNVCRRFVEERDESKQFIFFDIRQFSAMNQKEEKESIIIMNGEVLLKKYAACVYIASKLREPWPHVAKVLDYIPDRIGNLGYDFVAHNRGLLMKLLRIFGLR